MGSPTFIFLSIFSLYYKSERKFHLSYTYGTKLFTVVMCDELYVSH